MDKSTLDYEYPIDECDVLNKEKLSNFRKARSDWTNWIDGDPHHGILKQIRIMMWNDIAYRSFNESRRLSSEKKPTAAINGMLGEFLDMGYVSSQILSICKLTDRSSADPKKGVISLRRLFDEISKNREIITREIFVSYDGLPYNYSEVHNIFISDLKEEM